MLYTEVNKQKIVFAANKEMSQQALPVLFVHGAGGSCHTWSMQLKAEIENCCLMALDLPGHARSEGKGASSVQEYRDFIYEFCKALGLKKIVLAGHSMGGAITQSFALNYPDLLKGIILVGTGARLRVADTVLENAKKGINLLEYAYSPNTSEELITAAEKEFGLTEPGVRYNDYLACDKFDLMQEIQKIKTKALIICGEEDHLTPLKYSKYLQEKIQGSELKLFPNAGHMVMWEQSKQVNASIASFLKACKS